MATQEGLKIELVLLADKPKGWPLNPAKFSFFKKIQRLESKLLEATEAADQLENISGLFDGSFIKLTADSARQQYFEKAINLVINLSSSSKLPRYLIEHSNYGVWHYFYNSHLERDVSWAGIQEFNLNQEGILSGVMVYSSYFTKPRYLWVSYTSKQCLLSKTRDNLLWKMLEFMPVLCQQAARFEYGKSFIQSRHLATLIDKVVSLESICYCALWTENFLVLALGFLYAHIKRLVYKLALNKTWILLKSEQDPVQNFKKTDQAQVLYTVATGFVADPCLIEENGEQYVFFEEYVEATQRGRLVCLKLQDCSTKPEPLIVLEKDYHLSYPFVFKSEGLWYLVPESAENRTIDLYRCVRFPDQWEFVKSLMTNIDAYDATFYQYLGRWWMFVNLRPHPSTSPNELLYLFSADDLLADHWQAHPANPIINHADKARSAGALFERDGVIYRPSQNCAGSYGRGLNLNAIIEWNEHTYKEKTVAQCIPQGQASLHGMHSFSCLGNTVISDGIYTRKRWQKAYV
ncbi:hypothetical protein [uncultured Thiothrix sp.]|uniref:glucosamine inositolphosphorylceramide transferase family protein n=1 Tax=uncultured Thiothrix sp. TaxID=223185 RepID=UPI0026172631|nr:hypothetical protein [uncultured Thiothrix sp.]